jgi:alkylated DNA repair dioxygenase AlkB
MENKEEFKEPTIQILEPKGLFYFENIISDVLNKKLCEYFDKLTEWYSVRPNSKARQVIHFGDDNDRASRDPSIKLLDYNELFDELRKLVFEKNILPKEETLNQCIVNKYEAGQGINFHFDCREYEEYICCFTLASGVEINFYRDCDLRKLYVKPQSLYIMSGDARYKYMHGISEKKFDRVNDIIINRGTRISITFRTALHKFK